MIKPYVARELQSGDQEKIQDIVRKSNSLITTPSNIIDPYDIQTYRKASFAGNAELKALLDNNIFTRILPLINNRKEVGKSLDNDTLIASAIMCFLIHSGIEANPAIAVYERQDNHSNLSKDTQDYYFRIADHIHPQVYADLALQRITDVPVLELKKAKYAVDSNKITQEDIKSTHYKPINDEHYNYIYMNLLKAWTLYKKEQDETGRLKEFLNWIYENSLSDYISTVFIVVLLSNKRIGRMIKSINSTSDTTIIKEIKNSTWDLYYLSLLERLHQLTDNNVIWFFITRDKVLLELSQFVFSLSSKDAVNNFIGTYYPREGIQIFFKYINKINSRPEREKHRKGIIERLEHQIKSLENEVRSILSAQVQ